MVDVGGRWLCQANLLFVFGLPEERDPLLPPVSLFLPRPTTFYSRHRWKGRHLSFISCKYTTSRSIPRGLKQTQLVTEYSRTYSDH